MSAAKGSRQVPIGVPLREWYDAVGSRDPMDGATEDPRLRKPAAGRGGKLVWRVEVQRYISPGQHKYSTSWHQHKAVDLQSGLWEVQPKG